MVADAHALEHRLQRLLGEGNVVQRVAGAGEADHEAVADQLILPHAFDVGEVREVAPAGMADSASANSAAQAVPNSLADVTLGILWRSSLSDLRHSHDGGPALTCEPHAILVHGRKPLISFSKRC